MVGLRGLEPPTPAMSTRYSNQLSYKPILVPMTGIEPVRAINPRDFKSRASASSATSAKYLEAAPRFELGIKVLQTSALPLGYAANFNKWSG